MHSHRSGISWPIQSTSMRRPDGQLGQPQTSDSASTRLISSGQAGHPKDVLAPARRDWTAGTQVAPRLVGRHDLQYQWQGDVAKGKGRGGGIGRAPIIDRHRTKCLVTQRWQRGEGHCKPSRRSPCQRHSGDRESPAGRSFHERNSPRRVG